MSPRASIADRLTAALGQPFMIENRPGAGGSVGAKAVASAEPDGHTLAVQHARAGGGQPG